MRTQQTLHGCFSPAASADFAGAFPLLQAAQHFRKLRHPAGGLLSSLGLGTYLGEADDPTDRAYAAALELALRGGLNLVDTAINYRHQRSERVIGQVLSSGLFARDQIMVCTKAGFIPFDGEVPPDPAAWFRETYARPGLVPPGQLAAGSHCMAPVFLAHQLQRSLDNLGLECVDVFYLHNPETQQAELSREEFYRRVRAAFELLEKQVVLGRIVHYGIATWSGLRVPPDAPDYLDLQRLVNLARELAGETHHFRYLQLPYNLAMPEAFTLLNQSVDKPPYVSTLNAAFRLGLQVIGSSSLMAGQLAALPPDARQHLAGFLPAGGSDAELALQFVRSTASLTAGLVGMSRPEHVATALAAAALAPAPPAQLTRLLQQ